MSSNGAQKRAGDANGAATPVTKKQDTKPATTEEKTAPPGVDMSVFDPKPASKDSTDVQVDQSFTVDASKIYEILTNAKTQGDVSGSEVVGATSKVGDEYTTCDGWCKGKVVHLVKDSLIIHEFRLTEWADDIPSSTLMFHFTKGVHVKTRLIITVAKVPTSHERAMQVYWEQCAWGGIRKHLNDEKAQMPPRSLGKNVCHMEIPAKNPERAAKFYSEVFNWDVKEWNKDPLYYGFTSGPKNSPWGWCDGGFLKIDEKAERTEQAIIPYYNALPIEDYEKKVTAAGGKVIVAKNKTYFGTIARCEDTEGNSFVLYDHHM